MNKYNDQGQPHDPWEWYDRNGELEAKGNF